MIARNVLGTAGNNKRTTDLPPPAWSWTAVSVLQQYWLAKHTERDVTLGIGWFLVNKVKELSGEFVKKKQATLMRT